MTDSRFFILLPQFLEGTVPENSLSRASNYLKSRHFTKKKKKKKWRRGVPVGTSRPGRFCIYLPAVSDLYSSPGFHLLRGDTRTALRKLCKCFLWGKITCLA